MAAIKNLTKSRQDPSTRFLENKGIIMVDGGVYNEDHYFNLAQLIHQVRFHLQQHDQLICYLQLVNIDKQDLSNIQQLFTDLESNYTTNQKDITIFWVVPQGEEFLHDFGTHCEILYSFEIDVITL